MSDETQRDEKAKLLLEYTENKQQLLQLRARAARFGDALYEAASILKSEPERLIFEGESTPMQLIASLRKAALERALFDVNAIIEVRDAIRRLEERQRELEPRLSAFGISR